jgi:hypothetical protein
MYKLSRILFIAGVVLLAYGYISRSLKIYFFWDSKAFGWIVLAASLVAWLYQVHRSRKKQGKKTVWIRIGIGFLAFGLIILPIVIFKFRNSDAYLTAINFITSNSAIVNEIGLIRGYGLIPSGEIQSRSINGIWSGQANINVTVKGSKKYKDVSIRLNMTPQGNWIVDYVR